MIRERVALLTPRETEVMQRVVKGQANKVIAMDLGVSQRTVELHRARVMHKLKMRSLADLVRRSASSTKRTKQPRSAVVPSFNECDQRRRPALRSPERLWVTVARRPAFIRRIGHCAGGAGGRRGTRRNGNMISSTFEPSMTAGSYSMNRALRPVSNETFFSAALREQLGSDEVPVQAPEVVSQHCLNDFHEMPYELCAAEL